MLLLYLRSSRQQKQRRIDIIIHASNLSKAVTGVSVMKKAFPFILIVIEIICIIFINYKLGLFDAKSCSKNIQVPDGLELTLNKDVPVSKGEDEFILNEGITFTPVSIHSDSVLAMYDINSGSFVNIGVFIDNSPADEDMDTTSVIISWNDIKEQDQLQALKQEAEQKYQDDRNQFIRNGILRGIGIAAVWMIIGVAVTAVLIRKDKAGIAVILQIIPTVLLAFGLLVFWLYG